MQVILPPTPACTTDEEAHHRASISPQFTNETRPDRNDEVLSADAVSWSSAFLIRAFEERLLKLFSEGKLFGTVHTCIGQEFTGVAVASQLIDGDVMVSNHRCHGHYLARTGDSEGLMAEVMGRLTGICGGRGGSQHICAHGVFSNGIQGGMTPVSAGMALAKKLNRKPGSPLNIVVTFIGDGTLGEGTLYETLNILSKWDLPMMIVLENNLYAQSTSQTLTLAGDICARAEAFGIATYHGTTANPKALQDLMQEAVAGVREHSRPAFFRIDTSRLMAHSKGDDDRPKEELARYWAQDPIARFTTEFPAQASALKSEAEAKIDHAVALASAAPFAENGIDEEVSLSAPVWQRTEIEGKERVVNRIYHALKQQLERDPHAFLLGEDIQGPYGGAFKVTKDLSLLHPGRVRNTPISEAAIVGIASGLALAGMHPICEIMFGDFLTLAADQIVNHAAKFRWMYNDQVSVPSIIRTPMGGRRGYGATHSQCLEKHFLGVPGTRVLALNPRYDPSLVYERLFATVDRPTIVIENKTMYGEYATHQTIAGFWAEHATEDFPTTRIRSRTKPDVTLVCYGGTLQETEKAGDRLFEEHEIVVEILCPIQLYPLNYRPIADSAQQSGRILVIEEGQGFCGFGAEVVAAVHQATEGSEKPLIARRLSAKPHPLASSKQAELDSLPGADAIVAAVVEMMSHA
jgi:2-oxoisovalerate dehydrogenase E1 component